MKKIIAVILSLVIALTVSVQTFAVEVTRDEFYPIIIVPGYSSSGLYMNNEDGTKTHVWGIDTKLIFKRVLARSIDLAKGIGELRSLLFIYGRNCRTEGIFVIHE